MIRLSILLGVAIIVSSCSSLRVYSDLDRSVDFTQYSTLEFYGWADNSDELMNDFDRRRIEEAFANEFASRNINTVEEGQGDLVVALYIVTENRTDRSATTYHYGGYGRYYGYGPGYGWGPRYSSTHVHEYNYTVGTLIVSVYDAERQELIWEGTGIGNIDENPQNRERHIPATVARIMEQYPVQPAE